MRRALVLGDARCVDTDIEAALELGEFDAVAAANNMILRWSGRLDYAVTLHPDGCRDWVGIVEAVRRRGLLGRNRPQVWAHRLGPGVDRETIDWGGSSGLLCVKVLIEQGYDRIVLAGVPMTSVAGHWYSREPWHPARDFHFAWKHRLPILRDITRSMSGWTAGLLGRPDAAWLSSSSA